jgi:hypothetical protein
MENPTMPRQGPITPRYCLQKASGQAVVRLDGKDVDLGKHDTPESRSADDRAIVEWLASGRRTSSPAASTGPTVNLVMLAYLCHAQEYYVKDGRPTSEVWVIKAVIKVVRKLYGPPPTSQFGPLVLKACREAFIAQTDQRRRKARAGPATPQRTFGHAQANVTEIYDERGSPPTSKMAADHTRHARWCHFGTTHEDLSMSPQVADRPKSFK